MGWREEKEVSQPVSQPNIKIHRKHDSFFSLSPSPAPESVYFTLLCDSFLCMTRVSKRRRRRRRKCKKEM
jgi:hypothetical protein